MTAYSLGTTSQSRLEGVHPDLVAVVKRAIQISAVDFMVVEGRRTLQRQKKLVADGKSTTLNSRHLTGHAVDLAAWVDGKLIWTAPEHDQVAEAMRTAAAEEAIDLEWGGDWKSFVDPPHFQLSWKAYPKQDIPKDPAPVAAVKKATKAPVSIPTAATGLLAVVSGYVESAFAWLKAIAMQIGDLAPVQKIFVQAGANLQALTIGGIILAGFVAAKRMLEDD